ncbi:MAG: Calcineurin-like phosphoesterase superfamily domain protein [Gemmatimonadetes bacterium]|nr:Calcineurin-like phosphoesterase superfamily domain protein [Gemmatimonadota bacterium]
MHFLRSLPGRAGSLMINGDLFEFWFEWTSVVPRSSVRVLAALIDLHEAGIPVTMVAGNHDCWGGDVLREAGVAFQLDAWTGELGGWRARVEHGDGLRDREDRGYRLLRRVLRNPVAIRAFRALHPDLASRLAMGSSRTSRSYQPRDAGRGLRAVASAQLAGDRELELLVFGHSHVAALERMPSGNVYANAGSWLDRPTYLEITPQQVTLREWTGSAEGADVDVLERIAKEALP